MINIARNGLNIVPYPQGVLDRLSQVRPKVIFSVEAVRYNAKTHDHMKKLSSVAAGQ